MLFGINVAANVFEEKLDTIFGNLFQVSCFADNIMVIGYKEDQSDHHKVFTPPNSLKEKCEDEL